MTITKSMESLRISRSNIMNNENNNSNPVINDQINNLNKSQTDNSNQVLSAEGYRRSIGLQVCTIL